MNLTSPALTLASALFLAATPISFADTTPAGVTQQESRARPRSEILAAKRVVFLGDSITANATYVMNVAAALRSQKLASGGPEVLSVGLSSETVSGLSEDGHPFPRPCVHERLTRLLAALKADVIFACYGMNCGIYQPLDEERFEAFRAGMEKLHGEAAAAGARIIHITPPYFDPARKPTQGYYPEVLSRYSQWLVSQAERGWEVIDLHSAMREEALQAHQESIVSATQSEAALRASKSETQAARSEIERQKVETLSQIS
ncbi:MAG: hypothetical protein EBS01_11050, partial [Verrucomicrobia bacterium]|nr:hypothetical protein [Verrucomicrobiota bacterium]